MRWTGVNNHGLISNRIQRLPETLTEPLHLGHRQLLRTGIGTVALTLQHLVNFGLRELALEGADRHAAHEFTSMEEHLAYKGVKKLEIGNRFPFLGLMHDVNDGRINLGPGPKDLGSRSE